jgi:hypothetical protein
MTAEAADAVMKCAVNVDVPTRVRVAALDAFLGDPCRQKVLVEILSPLCKTLGCRKITFVFARETVEIILMHI